VKTSRPAGSSGVGYVGVTGVDGAGLDILGGAACRELLRSVTLGRVALTSGALPLILPVTFACPADHIVFCAPLGSTLDRATRGAVLCFEADQLSPDLERGWTVVAVGVARDADAGDAALALAQPQLARWVHDGRHRVVSLSLDQLTGRRLQP
jgi:nitroimidazol reductase NimA-like FMN-containing flavoprotein (pyridoxamine 5'-phosphate oxidase superfamily)